MLHSTLVAIITQKTALLAAYRLCKGTAYRPAQLGVDMAHTEGALELLFSRDTISRIVQTDDTIAPEDDMPLIASYGYFCIEKERR
jgi:hypothetical protein